MRLVLCLAVANALNVVRAPPKTQTMGAVAAWHATRKNEITRRLGRDAVAELEAPTPARRCRASRRSTPRTCTSRRRRRRSAASGGSSSRRPSARGAASPSSRCSTTSSTAALTPAAPGGGGSASVLKYGSQPSVFGYWLYLALGHLNHHAATGDFTAKELFASSELAFEDGDLFFASHRQDSPGGGDDDPACISIARASYRTLWNNGGSDLAALGNAAAYALSMSLERAALCGNDKLVALTDSNRLFFPNKPPAFHEMCGSYARAAALAQCGVVVLAHGDLRALAYLLVAETAWQVPPWPAASLFVSNHGVHDDGAGVGGAGPADRLRASGGGLFDALCFNANYHCEHHDFPKVPLWRLPELRRRAGADFYPESPPWTTPDAAFRRRVTYPKWNREAVATSELSLL
ncbi:fatty acid desaturase [Aureococcus anophagefferens]|nr:fatty acid desaturase [Aureococcus anophagefferens]